MVANDKCTKEEGIEGFLNTDFTVIHSKDFYVQWVVQVFDLIGNIII